MIAQYDPASIAFANQVSRFSYDTRGIAPPQGAATLYAVALIAGFAVECVVLGVLIRLGYAGYLRRRRPNYLDTLSRRSRRLSISIVLPSSTR